MEDDGYAGTQGPLDCKKYSQYCDDDGEPKSPDDLAKMRKRPKGGTPTVSDEFAGMCMVPGAQCKAITPTTTPTLTSTGTPPSFIQNYCGNISGLACAANISQDVATLIDLVGVGLIEGPAVVAGCIEGGPLGCAIAEVGVAVTWTLTLNNVETVASSASLGFTILDDLNNNGGWGENSSTSLASWAAGLLPLTPSWDLAVDTYASGYNHGVFNGVNTILTNGLFK